MSLTDDLNEPLSDAEITRRKALLTLGGGALTVAGLGTAITTVAMPPSSSNLATCPTDT